MSNALSRVIDVDDYAARFREKQAEIEQDAETNNRGLNERMAELVQMQQAEILKLQRILRDANMTPHRHAVSVTAAIGYDQQGRRRNSFVAIDNQGHMWVSADYSPAPGAEQYFKWSRLPSLPSPAAEAELGR